VIDLSVLICSTHTRHDNFGRAIQQQVWDQYNALPSQYRDRIEIIMLTDNKKMMLGHKRNVMVDMAQGRYVQFVDDDDRIETNMFRTILDAIALNPVDVITFGVTVRINGDDPKLCRYSIEYTEDHNTDEGYERLPNHICVVRRVLARKASFPNLVYGEDSAYAKLLLPHLKTEYKIPEVLYYYDYDSGTTETQQHLSAPVRRRDGAPIVDVVMLSNATSHRLYRMTQQAIDSCIAGANSLPVNIIVLEQQECEYRNATTIHAPGEFHYNRFANRGIRYGSAPWVMVANNDLTFQDGWLHHLLNAGHPVVSPKCPKDVRQQHILKNTTGHNNAEHFSGWCFMMTRELWEKIGGLDPDFGFWCADDATIEQVVAQGIEPMLVAQSFVQHRGSVTLKELRKPQDMSDLTWAMVDKFNRKYQRDKFADDPRFAEWKAQQ